MIKNPVLSFEGHEALSILFTVKLFDGMSAGRVRGVIADLEISPGESSAPWADAGQIAWLAYAGDPAQIEFLEFNNLQSFRHVRVRVVRAQRVRSALGWNTIKAFLSAEQTQIVARDFDSRDFSLDDFA